LLPSHGRAVLHRIQVRDAPVEGTLDGLDVDLGRQFHGRTKRVASRRACAALAREDTAQHASVVPGLDDGEDEEHAAPLLEERSKPPVEQLPDGRVDLPSVSSIP